MTKFTYAVFKAIIVSMLFVFIWDTAFYLYRVLSLNQRVESLMASMQRVIMENDYLPHDTAVTYQTLLYKMADDYNIGSGYDIRNASSWTASSGYSAQSVSMPFILAMDWNYSDNAVGTFPSITVNDGAVTHDVLRLKMGTPADYGDIMVLQFRVVVAQPMWEFIGTHDDASTWQHRTPATSILTYTYYVPCLKYKSITQ